MKRGNRFWTGLFLALGALWVAMLSGCAGPLTLSPLKVKALSASATGCPPEEIQATPREDPADGSVLYWPLECRGRKFHCAYARKYFGCSPALDASTNQLQIPLPPSALTPEQKPETPPAERR